MPQYAMPLGARESENAKAGSDLETQSPRRHGRAARWYQAWRQRFLDQAPIDVSVCIANWNCSAWLRACLESLLERPQGVGHEVIVVDNGSTDDAALMVERDFPEVILLRNESNVGFARANNQAALRSSGRYLFFLNNDTVIPPGTLRRLVEFGDAHPGVGMIGPRLRDATGQVQVSYRERPTLATFLHRTCLLRWTGLFRAAYHRYRRAQFDPQTTRPVDVLMGAAVLLPRWSFFAAGLWDEGYTFGGEDIDLSSRVNAHGPVIYLPEVEITHIGRVSTRQHIGYASTQMAAGFVRFLRKSGYRRWSLAAYKLIVTLDLPAQLLVKSLQYLWRKCRGRSHKADKSLLAIRGLRHFLLRGLPAFWKA